jgi:hypothetical protein
LLSARASGTTASSMAIAIAAMGKLNLAMVNAMR